MHIRTVLEHTYTFQIRSLRCLNHWWLRALMTQV